MSNAYFVGLVGSVVVLVGIWELLRRRQLREKYAILWLVIGIVVLVFSAVPNLLGTVSGALGFEVPANLLFFVSIVLLLAVTLHLSWELSRLEDETRKLAEDLAILRLEFEEMNKKEQRELD